MREGEVIEGQWLKGQWKGLERLECITCHWDTLHGLGAALEYKLRCPRCGPKPGDPKPYIPIYDAGGRLQNPIEESDT